MANLGVYGGILYRVHLVGDHWECSWINCILLFLKSEMMAAGPKVVKLRKTDKD